ncbi:MAG: ABC transporter ATP-binding protein [Antricoccus sp.]
MNFPDQSLAVEANGLVKTFGSFRALDGLHLGVRGGEVHGFLGPNGSGKSTAIRILLGLYHRTAGSVRVLGLDPEEHPAEVTRRVSYVPGEVQLWPNLTGQEVLDALAGMRGRYDPVAERRLVDVFALDPSRKVRTYSKGNRQKVILVAAFAARTDLLVLDEPTAGLDPLMETVFSSEVRAAAAEGRTVLLSSHILSEVDQLCESVTIIKDGRVVESGKVAQMRHLASSTITAAVPVGRRSALFESLIRLGIEVPGAFDPGTSETSTSDATVWPLTIRASVASVGAALGELLAAGADSITCTPATLEDLFLRHYEVLAR